MTTSGFSCQVTVHMPSSAWKITSATKPRGSATGCPTPRRPRQATAASAKITSPRMPAK